MGQVPNVPFKLSIVTQQHHAGDKSLQLGPFGNIPYRNYNPREVGIILVALLYLNGKTYNSPIYVLTWKETNKERMEGWKKRARTLSTVQARVEKTHCREQSPDIRTENTNYSKKMEVFQ